MKQRNKPVITAIILAAFVLGGFLASCVGPFGSNNAMGGATRIDNQTTLPGMGAIRLLLPATGTSRGTIIPAALASAHHYKITLTPSTGAALVVDNVTSSPWNHPNDTPGAYSLSVEAYNSASTKSGSSESLSITVASGETTTTSIAIAATGTQSMTGTGTLGTTISWPVTAVSSVTVTLYKQSEFLQAGATAVPLGTLAPDYATGKLSVSTSLASGNYVMVVQLSKDGVLYPPLYEAVQIYDGSTSDSTGTGTGTGTTTTAGLSVTATELGTAPTAPTGLFATKAADGKVSLYWSDASNTESGFKVYKDGVLQTPSLSALATSWTDTSTTAASTGYTVASYNGLGETISTALAITAVTGITVPTSVTVAGDATRIPVTFAPTTATFQDITWTSSDPTIATVDASGNVTPLKAGSVTITATPRGGGTAQTIPVTIPASPTYVGLMFDLPASSTSLKDNLGGTTPLLNKGTVPYDVITFLPPEGVDSYTWTVDGGTPTSANPGTLSLDSGTLSGGTTSTSPVGKTHTVTITVYKDGSSYTKTETFIVCSEPSPTIAAKNAITIASILNADDASSLTTPTITGDLNLPSTGLYGTTITWEVIPGTYSDPSLGTIEVVDPQGHVTRPSTTAQTVQLRATIWGEPITNGVPASTTISFNVSVKPIGSDSNTTCVETDLATIIPIRRSTGEVLPTTSPTVSGPLDLPSTGPSGTDITWTASPPGILSPDGTLTRPAVDTTVTLTAVVSKGTSPVVTETVTTTVTVLARPGTTIAQVIDDAKVLEPGYPDGTGPLILDRNIELPTTGPNGSPITWTVLKSDATAASYPGTSPIDPATGKVTLPATSTSVKLVATIGDGTPQVVKTFDITVKAKDTTTPATSDSLALEIGFQPGDNPGTVTGNLTLPTVGPNGSTITWAASPTVAAGGPINPSTGTVTRPTTTAPTDTTVTLTATITPPTGTPATKTYVVTVPSKPQADVTTATLTTTQITQLVDFQPGEGSGSPPSIKTLFDLPTLGPDGTTITWTFPNPSTYSPTSTTSVLSIPSAPGVTLGSGDPIPVIVTRPAVDTTVTLTATVIKNGVPVVISYPVLIPAKPATDTACVTEDATP
ncbi:MAG: Ig-like domain-containing protein, partial [Spirochaetota bacterium]